MDSDAVSPGYMMSIAHGLVPNHSRFQRPAFTPTAAPTETDIWAKAGVYVFPAAGTQMEILSSSVDDAVGGTGARKVRVSYLNSDYEEKMEHIDLDGTGVVPTVATDIFRVNCLAVVNAGTGLKAAGNITLRGVGAGATYSYVQAGHTFCRSSIYTVPSGYELYLTEVALGYGHSSNQTYYGRLYLRMDVDPLLGVKTNDGIFQPYAELLTSLSTTVLPFQIPLKLPEKCSMKASVIGSGGTNPVAVSVVRGYLEKIHETH